MTEVWNNVTVYGPISEIQRFKQTCLEPDANEYRDGQFGWVGCGCLISAPAAGETDEGICSGGRLAYVWNFQQFTPDDMFEYSFSFDCDHAFPEGLFEELAERFPRLAFDCSCIQALDEFMGYGWFNAPPGGEAFQQGFDVPGNYWTGGGSQKRGREAEAAHLQRIAQIKAAAIEDVCGT